ncbi:hypothetical protein Psi01_64320 [Planobispora siamensis]|uniref:Uncharacterized protein n=1 Tax=Planobispora siamensis TaxID=936338 RepID=A0A8J3SMZ9_9ACTN|nr:hypothetical protein Psi01_64320 [Planobispora siamensis]
MAAGGLIRRAMKEPRRPPNPPMARTEPTTKDDSPAEPVRKTMINVLIMRLVIAVSAIEMYRK